jgi:hypothetical protein
MINRLKILPLCRNRRHEIRLLGGAPADGRSPDHGTEYHRSRNQSEKKKQP